MAGNKQNNKKKTNDVRRKPNPLTVSHRVPRPSVAFDGQNLNGTGYFIPNVTIANRAGGCYSVDFGNIAGAGIAANAYLQSVGYDLLAIAKLYNEYVYNSLRFEWVPNVAPGVADAGSQMYLSYIDNAEEIASLQTATAATMFDVSKNARNSKFFNAWEKFVYNVPLSRRRKTFDTNYTNSYTTDTIDRSVQGAVVFGANSLTAGVQLGQWRVSYEAKLLKLNVNLTT
jgi:hypothetical protein